MGKGGGERGEGINEMERVEGRVRIISAGRLGETSSNQVVCGLGE